jgi:hypothetical protein
MAFSSVRGFLNYVPHLLQGKTERKVEALMNTVYNIGKELFGVQEGKTKRGILQQTPNRHGRSIKEC